MATGHAFPPPLRTPVIVTAALSVPIAVVLLLVGSDGLTPAVMALIGTPIALSCRARQSAALFAGLGLTTFLGATLHGDAAASVALVVVASLAAGLANRISTSVFAAAPTVAAVMAFEPVVGSPLRAGLTTFAVGLYLIAVVTVTKFHVPRTPVPHAVAWRHAIVIAIACGATTAIALHNQWPRGYWLPVTLAVVLRPYAGASLARQRQRITGTLAGAVIALLLSPLPFSVELAAAGVCMVLMLGYTMSGDYILQVAFLTPMLLLLIGAGSVSQTVDLTALRVAFTLGGCAIGAGLALLLSRDGDSQEDPAAA